MKRFDFKEILEITFRLYIFFFLTAYGIVKVIGEQFGLNFVQSVIGGQKGIEPIFNLDYPIGITELSIIANENFGIGLQISLLILSLIATEIYIRSKKSRVNNVYNA